MNKKIFISTFISILLLMTSFQIILYLPVTGASQPPLNTNVFFVGTTGLGSHGDPATAYDTASCEHIQNVYEPLIAFDRNLTKPQQEQGLINKFVGKLADGWTENDYYTITLTDLENLTFVDMNNPKYSIWEDPWTGKIYHINGWRDSNETGQLDICDVVYMEEIVSPTNLTWIPCTKFAWRVRDFTANPPILYLTVERTVYYFKLRTGVQIHPWNNTSGTRISGQILTTEDVEYSFERTMVMDSQGGPQWMLYKPILGAVNAEDGWDLTDVQDLIDLGKLIDCAFQRNATHFFVSVGTSFPRIEWYQILSQSWGAVVPKAFAVDHLNWPGTFFNATDYPHWIYWRRWCQETGAGGPTGDGAYTPLDRKSARTLPTQVPGSVPNAHADTWPVMAGTGPYKHTYKRPTSYRIDKFNAYWGGWAGNHVDTVIVTSEPNWIARRTKFLRGDYDSIDVPRAKVGDLLDPSDPSGNTPLAGITMYRNLPTLSSESLHFNFNMNVQIAISDPGIDAYEAGLTPGRSPIWHPHPPPEPPYTIHNYAPLVSHDVYTVTRIPKSTPCPGGNWALVGYAGVYPTWVAVIENVIIISPLNATSPSPNRTLWKEGFQDYALSGMPDFDQRQWGTYSWSSYYRWSHCAPTAVANSLWWFDSEFENNTTPPPAIVDNFKLVSSYNESWDDHDPRNVQPFIEHLAYLMDTDGNRTRVTHHGSNVPDIQVGLAQYLSWTGVNPQGDCNGDGTVNIEDLWIVNNASESAPGSPNWNMAADIWPATTGLPAKSLADNKVDQNDIDLVISNIGKNGTFYERTVSKPEFDLIKREVKKGEDVVLCVRYWSFNNDTGEWDLEDPYGHTVTVAGLVESTYTPLIRNSPQPDFFSNVHARKAFAYAINFTKLIDEAWFNDAVQPATWHIAGLASDYRDQSIVKYDIDLTRVRQELEAAIFNATGSPESLWDSGFKVTISYDTGNTQKKIACKIIENSIESLNNLRPGKPAFDITVKDLPLNTYLGLAESQNLPIFIFDWQEEDFTDADNWARPYLHSSGYLAQIQGYMNTTVDAEIDLAAKTDNETLRRQLYYDLQHTFINECPSVMLLQPYERAWMRDWLHGWYYNPIYPGAYFYERWKGLVQPAQAVDMDATSTMTNLGGVMVRGVDGQIWANQLIEVKVTRQDTNTVNVVSFYALIIVHRKDAVGTTDIGQDIVIMLGTGDTKTGEITWDEVMVPYGYDNMSADVIPLSTGTATLYDNVTGNDKTTGGTVQVLPPGEVSGDEGGNLWVVDGVDVVMLIERILLTTPRFNLNRDEVIDGQDIVICIEHVPTTYT